MTALSEAQIKERRLGIGSSDARVVAVGTPEEQEELRLVKLGKITPKPILSLWDASLRHHCEPLILDWYTVQTGRVVTRRGELVISDRWPMLRANLDGADVTIPKVLDAKMLNVWTPDPKQWVLDTYTWQIVHQILVTGYQFGALHVSLGMKEPYAVEIEYDEFNAMMYVDRCREFWDCVVADKEIPGLPPLPTPIPAEKMRKVDMENSNEWASAAFDWLHTRLSAQMFNHTTKVLKALVAEDVGEASGHGIIAKRDKRGAITIKEMKETTR